jgi:hypothetical protein
MPKTPTTEDGRHYDGYRLTKRGAKGVISLKSSEKNGELTAMRAVHGDEDLMVITTGGIVIRTPLDQVKVAGRNTQGVKIITLEPRHKVASLAIVPHEDPNAPEEERSRRTMMSIRPSWPKMTSKRNRLILRLPMTSTKMPRAKMA